MADLTAPELAIRVGEPQDSGAASGRKTEPLVDVLYPCNPNVCIGFEGPDGGPEQALGTKISPGNNFCSAGNTGVLCATCINTTDVKINGVCRKECDGGAARFIISFVVRYSVLGLLLRRNAGYLDVAIDGATIAHMTFFFQVSCLFSGAWACPHNE